MKSSKNEELLKFPIRILCVFSSLDRGGAESMVMNIYRKINREINGKTPGVGK